MFANCADWSDRLINFYISLYICDGIKLKTEEKETTRYCVGTKRIKEGVYTSQNVQSEEKILFYTCFNISIYCFNLVCKIQHYEKVN